MIRKKVAVKGFTMGGAKKQTNKLEHTQTNSPSMHFICENTN